MNWLGERVASMVLPTDRVLDLGAGVLHPFGGKRLGAYHMAVDAHAPYLEQIGPPSLCGALPAVLDDVRSRIWDVVLLIDVLEHLPRELGVETLDRAIGLTSRLTIAFTPDGWCPQGEECGAAWGHPWNEWQRHRSAFTLEDFTSRGFQTETSPIRERAPNTANCAVLAWRYAE